MRVVLRRFKNRLKSDRGDAILVMSVIFVPFFFICAGFAMDLTKAAWVKQQYQTIAQEATHNAARSIETTGAIKESAVQTVVTNYVAKFNGQKGDTGEGTIGVRDSSCKTVDVNGTTKNAPYIEITLDGGRNNTDVPARKYISNGGGPAISQQSDPYDINLKYYSIRAKIWDTAPNLMMGMFGRPCQQVVSEVSSINFGSQEDLEDDIAAPVDPEPEPDEWEWLPGWIQTWGSENLYPCTITGNTVTWTGNGGVVSMGMGSNEGMTHGDALEYPMTSPGTLPPQYSQFFGIGTNGSGEKYLVACQRTEPAPPLECTPLAGFSGTTVSATLNPGKSYFIYTAALASGVVSDRADFDAALAAGDLCINGEKNGVDKRIYAGTNVKFERISQSRKVNFKLIAAGGV